MTVAAIKVIDIEIAAGMDDLDHAANHLQDLAGITTGDVVSHFLNEKAWNEADRAERVALLRGWLKAEKAYEERYSINQPYRG
jgi:hypothetical protein